MSMALQFGIIETSAAEGCGLNRFRAI